jgi:Lrp/AsnC family leucine-responsive transcriptional regulator
VVSETKDCDKITRIEGGLRPRAAVVDSVDQQLITLLTDDGRTSASALAAAVGLSQTAVTRRLKRLEVSGVIAGYTVRVDHARLGLPVEALIEIRFAGRTRPKSMDDAASSMDEVVAVFTVSGNYDALVWVRLRDIPHLTQVIDALRQTSGVVDTRSHVILASHITQISV